MADAISKPQSLRHRARLMMEMFVNRTDIYAVQWADEERHGYRAVRERLTVELVEKHLRGEVTLGLYALSGDSTAKWMAIDVDSTVVSELEAIMGKYREMGLPEPIVEFSGRRGYHFIWLYEEEPVAGWKARALGRAVTTDHEVFPKSSAKVSSRDISRPGACLKLMLGRHQVSGRWSVLTDEHFEELSDPWKRLRNVERVNISDYEHLVEREEPSRESGGGEGREVEIMRPCVKAVLRAGTQEGARNQTAHIISSELRRLGVARRQAAGALATWNLRNEPSLPREELATVLRSAYEGEPYEYSCHPDGPLQEVLECIGEGKCPFKRAVRRQQQERFGKEEESHQ